MDSGKREIASIARLIKAGYVVSACGGMLVVNRLFRWEDWCYEVARSNDPHAPDTMRFKDAEKAAKRFVKWRAKMESGQ